jgi:DNA-binding NarL/FixJ family response regulator
MNKKRVIIIDDEPLLLHLIKELIEEEPLLEVARITTTKEEFLDAVSQEAYDIAVIDISVGKREGGMDILQFFNHQNNQMPVIVLSAHDEHIYGLKCLIGGARGYIGKEDICSDLIKGISKY